jgi:hypothetical protein
MSRGLGNRNSGFGNREQGIRNRGSAIKPVYRGLGLGFYQSRVPVSGFLIESLPDLVKLFQIEVVQLVVFPFELLDIEPVEA